MNKKRLIITSLISIILVSILMLGSTYSIFTTSDIDEELNVYTTGNLDITYTLYNGNITLADSEPTSKEDENTVVPYRITVENKGTVPYMFDLSLEDTTASNVIDYQYIITKVGYLDSKSLSSCTNNIIKEDIILPAGESVDIDVRVYISEKIPNKELGKSFFAKLKVDGIAIYDKNEEIDNSVLSLRFMKPVYDSSTYNYYLYYKSDAYRQRIKNVYFVDYINDSSIEWDLSEKGDQSIMAWLTDNATAGYYDLYIGSDETIFSLDLSTLFAEMVSVDSIHFDNLDTSLNFSTAYMFFRTGDASSVFTLDLGDKFDTSNVINMSNMFAGTGYNNSEFTLDLGDKFDTSNVTDMQSMFCYTGYNSTVITLDLGDKFDTSKVTNMKEMFSYIGCSNPNFTLDLGDKFDTSKVTNMYDMFASVGYNSTVFTLDLGDKFDTSNVTDMHGMFYQIGYGSPVFNLDLGDKFDTSNVTDMQSMFYAAGYSNESFSINLGPKFYTPKVWDMETIFREVGNANSNLELDLSTFTFTQVTDSTGMFDFFKTTQKIYVKDAEAQTWILNKGFANLSTNNVLIKS